MKVIAGSCLEGGNFEHVQNFLVKQKCREGRERFVKDTECWEKVRNGSKMESSVVTTQNRQSEKAPVRCTSDTPFYLVHKVHTSMW